MNKITLTLDLTPKNLDLLKAFCDETNATAKVSKTDEEKPKTKKATKKTAKPDDETPAPAKEDKKESVTLTDVRAVALKLSKAGKQDALKEAFANFGAKKLSDVNADDYPALIEELNAISTEDA